MATREKVYNWLNVVQRLIYPHHCVLCQTPSPGRDLCHACEAELPWNQPACPRCAHPLAQGVLGPCGDCLRQPPPFARAYASFRYAYPMDHLLQAFKFNQRLHLAPLLGQLMAEDILRQGHALPERIIPVPLHRRRLLTRGYNQALELGRSLATRLAIPLDTDSLWRIRATRVQSELSARERRKNLRQAFSLKRPIAASHVAILDDVVSTGSTVSEIARVLKRAGVEQVEVWSCARTERQR